MKPFKSSDFWDCEDIKFSKAFFYLDLPLHGDAEEHDEVHYKYRPEHRYIEGIEKCANHGDDDAFCCWMPVKKSEVTSVKAVGKESKANTVNFEPH